MLVQEADFSRRGRLPVMGGKQYKRKGCITTVVGTVSVMGIQRDFISTVLVQEFGCLEGEVKAAGRRGESVREVSNTVETAVGRGHLVSPAGIKGFWALGNYPTTWGFCFRCSEW